MFLIATLVASTAAAQLPPPPARTDRTDDIVVEGRRNAVLRNYVRRMARPELRRQLARWTEPLCVKYEGMGAPYATFIQRRLTDTATRIGLKMGRDGCRATILVKLADDADALAKAWAHLRPPRIGSISSTALPSRRDVAAIEAPHVVRWMTATETVSQDGVPIGGGGMPTEKPQNRLYSSSLIRSTTREDVRSKIILIDARRLANVSLDQLADYITFVTLASPDIAADFADVDSIMALFADGSPAPARMTRQDLAFLDALYAVPMDRPVDAQTDLFIAHMRNGEKTDARR